MHFPYSSGLNIEAYVNKKLHMRAEVSLFIQPRCVVKTCKILTCIYFYDHECAHPWSTLHNPLMGYVIAICHVNGRSLSSILGL